MRIYLLSSVILSLVLPFLILPVHWSTSIHPFIHFNNWSLITGAKPDGHSEIQTISGEINNRSFYMQQAIVFMIIAVYLAGVFYKAFCFFMNLRSIQKCIRQNEKIKDSKYWFVELKDEVPPFSFFNYIFIPDSCRHLPDHDLQRIRDHEKVHAQHLHSFDVLLIEFVSVIFWFNPVVIYLKKSVQEIHEYIVDEKIAGTGKKGYAELLLKLASDVKGFNLSAGFSGSQIKRRIAMIARQRSLPIYKLIFLILIPVTIFIMLSFSYIKSPDFNAVTTKYENINQSQLKIGKIIWLGNTVYDIATLNKTFGLKEGSVYNKTQIDDRLNGSSGAQDAVSNLYQDNGYIFSRISFSEEQNKEVVNLTITIEEGIQAKFNDIIVKIDGVVTKDPVNEIVCHKGELFSKAKIIKSVVALAASGKYDPLNIFPKPDPQMTNNVYDKVDMIFELTTISNKK
jgi:hypothetical protein